MFIDLRVRGMEGERERNMDVTDNTDQLPLVHAPMGTNQQPWHVPSQGMEPATFLFTAWCSDQLRHTGHGRIFILCVCMYAYFKKNNQFLTFSFKKEKAEHSNGLLNILILIIQSALNMSY